MENNVEILDLPEDVIRQYIDARQTFTAWEQARVRAAEFRGGMVWKTVSGRDYLIRTSSVGSQTSLGPRSPETEAIFQKFTSGKARAEEMRSGLKAAIEKHRRLNRALRVGRAPNIAIAIINALNEAGMGDKFMIVGTHALYAYETAAGVRINERHLETKDVDLLWDNRKQISLVIQQGPLANRMLGFLQRIDPSFAMRSDQLYTAVNKDGYEVDILRRMGPGSDKEPRRITDVPDDFWVVKARNADWLLSAPKFSEIIVGTNGQMARMVTVDPRAFVLFKLWMAEQPDRDPPKRIRDSKQAHVMIDLINERLPQLSFADIKVFPSTISNKTIEIAEKVRAFKEARKNPEQPPAPPGRN